MIAEGDHVAVLLPTYGHFTGTSETGPPPTGGRLDYGMVNMVRLDDGMIVETWFGMDPLVEMQQLGLAPPAEPRPVTPTERANLDTFAATKTAEPGTYDNVVAFGDVIVAMGPPQDRADTVERRLELYRIDGDRVTLSYRCVSSTKPPYGGDPGADTEAGRAVVGRWTDEVLSGHDPGALDDLTSPHVLVHPTAMPCEAGFYGRDGTRRWLEAHWTAFPDLVIADSFTIAHGDIAASRWTARGTSRGEFMGLPPTGGVVEFTGVTMYRIEDDLIAEIWDTRNTLGILGTLDPGLGAGHHHHHH
jgi:predicted ester cyclase